MRPNRKHIVVIACVVLCIVVSIVIALHRPKRHIVIEVEGPVNHDYKAILVVDGQRQVETVALPKTFRFYAREVSYGIVPSDTSADSEISGHMYIEDKSIDFSSTGRSVGGNIKSPQLLGVGTGDFTGFTGVEGSPYLVAPGQ